jgi:hypothetical protein
MNMPSYGTTPQIAAERSHSAAGEEPPRTIDVDTELRTTAGPPPLQWVVR